MNTVTGQKIIDIDINKRVLESNDKVARKNRELLKKYNIKSYDIMGSVGTGKTSLLETITEKLNKKYRIAVIAGDLTTTIDADRIKRHHAETIQINTGRVCHLEAPMVHQALLELDLSNLDVIFVENVGNLICPAGYSLGVDKRIVVISVTEGPYMIRKHPLTFKQADIVAINKADIAEIIGINIEDFYKDMREIDPRIPILPVSAKTGYNIDKLIELMGL